MRTIRTDAAPTPVAGAPYSQAVAEGPGELVWVSGQIAVDPGTGRLVEGDARTQAALVLRHLAAVLAAAGCGLHDVVKTTVYLTDLAEFGAVNEVYALAFGDSRPARATVGVASLPLGALVEIEAVAAVPAAAGGPTRPTGGAR